MKKIFTVAAVLLFAGQHLSAQSSKLLAYRLGVSANMPFITSYTDSFKAQPGFGIWGDAEYMLSRHFRLNPGIGYNSLSYVQWYFRDSSSQQRRRITEHYIDITAHLNYLPSPSENSARLYLGAGVSLLALRKTTENDIVGVNMTQRTLDNKKSLAPGLLLMAGFSAPMSRKIDLGIQYTLGLPNEIYPQDIIGRLSTLNIRVSYKIIPDFKDYSTGNAESLSDTLSERAYALYNPDSLVMIVRLNENTAKIETLKSQGYYADARKLEEETREENLEIMEAFKEAFTLLPVYYIYDTDSKQALSGNFNGILLNTDLKRADTLTLPGTEYVFAEFKQHFDEVSQTSGMYGLVITDQLFNNLPSYFPGFTSDVYGFLSKKEVVSRHEKKMRKYFGTYKQ